MSINESVQTPAQSGAVTATTVTATFGSTPTQGNLLVSVLGTSASPGTITPPSGWSTPTNFPIDAAGAHTGGGQRLCAVAFKIAGAAESKNVQWGTVNSNAMDCCAIEASSTTGWNVSPEDTTTNANSSSVVLSLALGTTATTAVADELAISACCEAARTGQSFNNGYTIRNTDGFRGMLGTKALTATGTTTSTAAWTSTTSTAAGGIVTFKTAVVVTNTGQFFAVL